MKQNGPRVHRHHREGSHQKGQCLEDLSLIVSQTARNHTYRHVDHLSLSKECQHPYPAIAIIHDERASSD